MTGERGAAGRLRRAGGSAAFGAVMVLVGIGAGFAGGDLVTDRTSVAPSTYPSPSPTPAGVPEPSRAEPVESPQWAPAVRAEPSGELGALSDDDVPGLLRRAATTYLASAPIVVVGPLDNPAGMAAAAGLARDLRAPLLAGMSTRGRTPVVDVPAADDAANADVVDELSAELVVVVGGVAPPRTDVPVHRLAIGPDHATTPSRTISALRRQAGGSPVPSPAGATLVRPSDAAARLAAVTARAAGDVVVPFAGGDPRADPALRERLARVPDVPLTLLGWDEADTEDLGWRLAAVRRGEELPGGGQLIFPHHRFVALYGNPAGGALGVLGEQPLDRAIVRARELAEVYGELSPTPVVPTFEIIATVASASAGSRGDYSSRTPLEVLERWVDAAGEAGLYVVLDLQPGRTDFLTQAREFEDLLARPHVGLALDPEWRLGPDQVHLRQIGSVGVDEVNEVVRWLADLTRSHALPQKLLVLHQFRLTMIRDRARLDTARDELAIVIQNDGQGSQPAKLATYRALTTLDPPTGVRWGWKNFHDEDHPIRSPADTLSLRPLPWFVSYQ